MNEVKRFFTIKEYRVLLLLGLKYGRSKRYQAKQVSFSRNKFNIADFQSFFWQYKQIYVDQCYAFKSTSVSPVIIDCGANVGLSALYFSRNYTNAKVIAYEADTNVFKCLTDNILISRMSNVVGINKAVWINNEGVSFSVEGADGGAVSSNKNAKTISVESISLVDILAAHQSVDLLKIDIEGAEVEVIRSAKEVLKKCKNIFVEYHSFKGQPQYLHEILSILSDNGFRYYVKEEVVLAQPFVTKGNKGAMDMQINIFAYTV